MLSLASASISDYYSLSRKDHNALYMKFRDHSDKIKINVNMYMYL